MSNQPIERPITGYLELASAQLLDDKWRELSFDLATSQNVLQDLVMPESGSGHVYRDSKLVGSATHNRFLYWRTTNDLLELVEMSTESVLEGNQVRIRFVNSPIINDIVVIEFAESIAIMVVTINSIHRLHLSHPKTTNASVLSELNNDVLYTSTNYYIINNHINSQHPICSTSWHDKSQLSCALSFPNSSMLVVQFSNNNHHITSYEIKQTGIIGRIWANLSISRGSNEFANAVIACAPLKHRETNDVLLFCLCKDLKIRVFSTKSKECILTSSILPQANFSQSYSSHANLTIEQPMMKLFGSRLVIYLSEARPEFVIMNHYFENGVHGFSEKFTTQGPNWEKLIDFYLTEQKIWALATIRETESSLCYLDMRDMLENVDGDGSEIEGVWDFVNLVDELDPPTVKNYVTEIFWRNRFSLATVQTALVGIAGANAQKALASNELTSTHKKNTMAALEWVANTCIMDDNQDEAWARFYNYCLQNHHVANKNIGLIVSDDESLICIIKRSNPSFICPWLVNVDVVLQGGPYRGIEFSTSMRSIIEPLNYISTDLIDDDSSRAIEDSLFENPSQITSSLADIMSKLMENKKVDFSKLNFNNKNLLSSGIDFVLEQLDLTDQAEEYGKKVLQHKSSSKMRSNCNPLESNSGILITLELFKRLVRARMILARDLLIYIYLLKFYASTEKGASERHLKDICSKIYNSDKYRRILDSLRSYALLIWLSETPIKRIESAQSNYELVNFIAKRFHFFKQSPKLQELSRESTLDLVLLQNLLTNFLVNGGTTFSTDGQLQSEQTISNSFYVTEITLNLCKLMWPKSNHLCLIEFLFTHQLDDHLDKYLNLSDEWLSIGEYDRHFIRASNCILQNRATQSVEIFNRLWMNMTYSNLLGRFINLDKDKPNSDADENITVDPSLIYRYYEQLIQLFQIYNNYQCLVMLLNQCMSLLDGSADTEQQHWINCFRAKLFQYYLELDEPDEAYHTMVLTTDPCLRTNCLRKFIVTHCEKEQWSSLLSYPFIDIKEDFIEILKQKAESSDLSKLDEDTFYKTSYYDLLFASYVSDEEFERAASVMYLYAQRLAHEVPGTLSIRKQADCLLIALNALRCVDQKEAYIETGNANQKEAGRTGILKRAYDCESEASFVSGNHADAERQALSPYFQDRVDCRDLEMNYELTRARLKLLEKDRLANAIALSPLKAEETIAQLVASSMFSAAMSLAILFKAPIEPVMEGLTAKYVFIMRLSTMDMAVNQDIERDLMEVFTSCYSLIDTYNYTANSSKKIVDRLWCLIDHYLTTYDGISHRYSTNTFSKSFSGSTVLLRIVANKLLSAGYNVPASLKRMYMTRNTAELLKLLIKYNKLVDAAELAIEMTNKILEPASCFTFTSPYTTSEPPSIYLPTHLIILLITYLSEDATNTTHLKAAAALMDRMNKFRSFVKSSSTSS